MIERALIQEQGMGRLLPEMRDARDAALARGLEVTLFVTKRMERRQLPLSPRTLVVGEIPTVEAALRQLGVEPPGDDSYPEPLRPFLLRRVWPSSLGEVEQRYLDGDAEPVFVKPRERLKRFTGLVLDSPSSLAAIGGASRRTPVWCSELVHFLSEWRAYVIDGVVLDVLRYAGDAQRPPDRGTLDEAVRAWTASGRAARGYGIDFGVLDDGRTALVELNDGYGLGSYGFGADRYLDLCIARWEQLTGEG